MNYFCSISLLSLTDNFFLAQDTRKARIIAASKRTKTSSQGILPSDTPRRIVSVPTTYKIVPGSIHSHDRKHMFETAHR